VGSTRLMMAITPKIGEPGEQPFDHGGHTDAEEAFDGDPMRAQGDADATARPHWRG